MITFILYSPMWIGMIVLMYLMGRLYNPSAHLFLRSAMIYGIMGVISITLWHYIALAIGQFIIMIYQIWEWWRRGGGRRLKNAMKMRGYKARAAMIRLLGRLRDRVTTPAPRLLPSPA